MQSWLVASALIEGPEGLLLVQNRRRDGSLDWTPPGGVIDAGESVHEGLEREVLEETGLSVLSWAGPAYVIEAEAPDLRWRLRVEVHRAGAFEGTLRIDDPDGIVVDACFLDPATCAARVDPAHHWVREPLQDWLADRPTEPRRFDYLIEGRRLDDLRVHRR